MAPYEWTGKAFTKQCSSCDTVYIGTSTEEESIIIFKENFSANYAGSDNLQSSCRKCMSDAMRRFRAIPIVDREAKLKEQKGLCPICKRSLILEQKLNENNFKRINELTARSDHDKYTGKSRGLLCNSCNWGIGWLRHSPIRMARAISYLMKYGYGLSYTDPE